MDMKKIFRHGRTGIFASAALFALLMFVSSVPFATAQEEGQWFSQANTAAKQKDYDAAYMYFNSLLTTYPDSAYREQALFACGEYAYMRSDLKTAASMFVSFVSEYPEAKGKVFAMAYLLKISEAQGNSQLSSRLANQIVTYQQLSLLFRNSKEYRFRSPLYRKLRVIYYIDKVEFYADGELFAQVSY